MSYDASSSVPASPAASWPSASRANSGKRVLVLDRRPHVGGNAYDEPDAAGVLIHRYGPHIFHTNSPEIVDYLSAFTDWRPYEHRVLACVRGQLVPIPINRTTVNRLFGLGLKTEDDVAAFYASRARAGRARAHVRGRRGRRRRAASCTSCSSAATRASSGASTRASSTRR